MNNSGSTSPFLNQVLKDRYEVNAVLGKGGMGIVYEAFDRLLDELVALKILRPELTADPHSLERFKREIRIARKISHPNVVKTYDFDFIDFDDDRYAYISMELIRGGTLSFWLGDDQPLTVSLAIPILLQICSALESAHRMGVVHRDLKPSNVFMEQSFCKLADFGVASATGMSAMTKTGHVVGTPAYMAPELIHPDMKSEIDHRIDIYSLGIMMFEMLTGRRPFLGKTPVDVVRQQVEKPAPKPRKFNPKISEDLEKIILKCLVKNPGDRYPSASEVQFDLMRASGMEDETLPAPIHGYQAPESHAEKKTKKRPQKAAAAAPKSVQERAPVPEAPGASPAARQTDVTRIDFTFGNRFSWLKSKYLYIAAAAAGIGTLGWFIFANFGVNKSPLETPGQSVDNTLQTTGAQKESETLPADQTAATGDQAAVPADRVESSESELQEPIEPANEITDLQTPEGDPADLPAKIETNEPATTNAAIQPTAADRARQAGVGRLRIEKAPADTKVLVDGKAQELMEGSLELPIGFHEIVLRHPDYEDHVVDMNVGLDQSTTLYFQGKPKFATLIIESNIPGADVYFDGQRKGVSPLTLHKIRPGKHTIRLQKVGYRPQDRSVEVAAAQASMLRFALERAANVAKTGITVDSVPPGATVLINGRRVGTTPYENFTMTPGKYNVEVTMGGYKPKKKKVTVAKGSLTRLEVDLKKKR